MRWSILILISLSLSCSKKAEPTSSEAEPVAAQEAKAATNEGAKPEAADVMADPTKASGFKLADLPPLPPELEGETPALGAPPTITLVEQGAEPRKTLQWQVPRGFEQSFTTELGTAMDTVIILIRSRTPMKPISYDLSLEAKNVKKDGEVQVAFKIDGARPAPVGGSAKEQTEAEKARMRHRTNLVGSYTLSPQGVIRDFSATHASTSAPTDRVLVESLRWAFTQMTPVVPDEPVGPGAKWTVHESITQGGIHVNQLRTFELVRHEGNRVELSIEVRQTASPQPYTAPSASAKPDLETMNGIANGTLSWDLGQLAPLEAGIRADDIVGATHRSSDGSKKAGVAIQTARTIEVAGK